MANMTHWALSCKGSMFTSNHSKNTDMVAAFHKPSLKTVASRITMAVAKFKNALRCFLESQVLVLFEVLHHFN